MANNRIQIKRSTTTAITNTTPSINAGELVFSSNGYILAIGDPANSANVISIGGARFPGVLTANQALVANTTSGIDKVIVANLAANSVWANGSAGSAGQVLTSNGTVIYWNTPLPGVVGSDTQVQFNDGGSLGADAGFTFVKATDTLTVNGSFVVPGTGTGTGGSIQNSTVMFVGNNTINTVITSAGLTVNGTATIANSTGVYTGVVNAASHTVGTAFTANSTVVNAVSYYAGTLLVANTTVINATHLAGKTEANLNVNNALTANNSTNLGGQAAAFYTNATNITTGTLPWAQAPTGTVNTSGSFTLSGNTTLAGTNTTISSNLNVTGSFINVASAFIANSTGAYHTGLMNAASFNTGATGTGAGGTTQNTTTVFLGNNTINTVITSAGLNVNGSATIANSSGVFTTGTVNGATISVGTNFAANTSRVTIAVPLFANGGSGSAGQILASNGATGSPYWTTAAVGTITGVTAGAGLTGGGASGSVTLDVGAGNGISVSADAIAVNLGANSGLVANTTGLFVASGNGLATNTTALSVRAGDTTIISNATGVYVNSNLSLADLTVSGNLTVLGDLVSLNVATLSVEDNIITLAKDQSSTSSFLDALDIGFFGTYGNTSNAFISGLFRDQSDSGIWKLFASNGAFTNAIIDTANTNAFRLGTLQTFLTSSGLITNAGSVFVTANSTVNVNISANVISLSGRANNDLLFSNSTGGITGLALGVSGYVVQSNGTAIVYDWLDGGTF